MVTPSAHIQSIVSLVLVLMHLAHCPVYCQETEMQNIHVEECVLFPEMWNRYLKLQPKPTRVTYAQAASSCPPASEISTQTDSVPSVPVSGSLKFYAHHPNMQPKLADTPKEPQATNL
jgi:hypothetical protein